MIITIKKEDLRKTKTILNSFKKLEYHDGLKYNFLTDNDVELIGLNPLIKEVLKRLSLNKIEWS